MPYRPDVFLVDRHEPAILPEAQPAVTFPGEFYHPADDPTADAAIRDPQAAFVYRLGGPTCLAGDVTGDFAFHRPLVVGDVLVFDDMAHYTMVKTTTFNGVKHPAIILQGEHGSLETIREFTYADFRDRLA